MVSYLFLLAFGFGNLALLGWLAAAAAPLLIHLWSRHRFREAPWAAMQFLLAAMRKNARRLQLQQWLLLAVRTLIIALVVLAAAEPYGERLLAGRGNSPTHHVLVIDGSYSMAYRDGDQTRFQMARQLAASLVRNSRPADTFTVILMAAPARAVLGQVVVDHATVAAEIESLSQPQTGADLVGALTRVQEAIADATNSRNPRVRATDRQAVHFFTDLQRLTWQGEKGDVQSASANSQSAVYERIADLAQRASLRVIDIGQPRVANTAVTRLAASDSVVTPNREITFEVTLHQFGPEPRSQCNVELLVDDVPVGSQTVDIPAGGEATLRFANRFTSRGSHTVAVRADADHLNIDDTRYLVVPVREEVRVLCVAGRAGAARYVARALRPSPNADSPIRPIVVSEGDLAELELSSFDCIFLCNIAQFTVNEVERLRRYVARGGGLVVFLGDRVVLDSYNAIADGSDPLLPARPSELVSLPQFGLDPLDYRHSIVAPFRGRERAGLLTTPVARYYRLDLSTRPGVEVAAALPNGAPLIVTAPLGRGRTVVVATAGSTASIDAATGEPWTNWPTWPSFLPIVREMLAYAASGRQVPHQQLVGTPLGGTLAADSLSQADPRKWTISRPDKGIDPVAVQSTAARDWSYDRTDLSGIYTLLGLPNGELLQFAVNVDTAESNLAKIDPQQLPPELSLHDTWQKQTDNFASTHVSRAGWHESLLWGALALLFIESFLAWRFGRGAL